MPQMSAIVPDTVPTGLKRKDVEMDRNYHLQDPDTLDRPICYKLLSPPVYQCENGHSVCAPCCKKLKNAGCPSCKRPVGRIRNRTVEKILESVQVACKNAPHGCKEMLKISNRELHEKEVCEYQPFSCPVPECSHKGSTLTLPQHMTEEHQIKTVESNLQCGAHCIRMEPSDEFVLLKNVNQELFLLHREAESGTGDTFFCTSFGAHKRSYDLKVMHNFFSKSYSMNKVLARNILDWVESEALFVDTLFFPKKPGVLCGYDVLISDLQSLHSRDSDTEEENGAEEENGVEEENGEEEESESEEESE